MSPLWYAAAIPVAGLGAVLRVWVTRTTEGRLGAPTATALVNIVGAALLGALVGSGGSTAVLLLGTGLLGGFTTFSTWMVEADVAHRDGRLRAALLLLVVPLVLGVAACAATRAL
jgi:CrcB protein